ncbi:MAG: ATP-binding protein [Hyphomicrobiaceae bacterium]
MAVIERLPRLFRTTAYTAMAIQVAVLVLAAAVAGWFLLTRVNTLLSEGVVESLRLEARGLADVARSGGPPALEAAIADRVKAGASHLYILTDDAGRKIAGNLNRWPPELAAQSAGGMFRYIVERQGQASERMAAGLPLMLISGHRLIVARDIEEQRAFTEGVRMLVLGGLILMTAVGIGIGTLTSRYVLRRIATVTTAAETIMAGNLAGRIARNGSGDEIDDLAARLNEMLERIERLMAGLREISDNIAHDLKTPLSRLRNRAEAALRDDKGAPAYREGLQRTIEAADEIIATFNALLLIARLEAGAADGAMEVFDAAAAVADLVELYEPVAEEAAFDLAVTVPDRLDVRANRQLFVQAVANLLDNAIKYGGPVGTGRGSIAVALGAADGSIVVEVADRGAGIAAADRGRALERFVRLEASRTRPGTGLGLSLVAAVARLHGGAVRLADNGPGLKVALSLPMRGGRESEARARSDV